MHGGGHAHGHGDRQDVATRPVGAGWESRGRRWEPNREWPPVPLYPPTALRVTVRTSDGRPVPAFEYNAESFSYL